MILNIKVKRLGFFSTQMADGTVNKFKTRLDSVLPYFLDFVIVADTFYVFVRAEFKINLIRVINKFLGEILSDEGGQVAADLVTQREFTVRECACAGKSRCNVAIGFAVYALFCFCFGTTAFFNGLTFFNNKN